MRLLDGITGSMDMSLSRGSPNSEGEGRQSGVLPIRRCHNFCEQIDKPVTGGFSFSTEERHILLFLFLVTFRLEAILNDKSPARLKKIEKLQ